MFRKSSVAALVFAFCLRAQQPMVRGTLGIGTVLLGKLASANMNVTTDQSITINFTGGAAKSQVTSVTFTNCSANVGTGIAAGAIYTAASKGGTAVYSTGQVYTAASTTTTLLNPVVTLTISISTNLSFSLTTANGSAGTCDIYIFGTPLP